MTKTSSWQANLLHTNPLFEPLNDFHTWMQSFADWPNQQAMQAMLEKHPNFNQVSRLKKLHLVPQADKPTTFEQGYEPRIYLKGELQTRESNWHDLFNLMVWLTFPNTKAYLNDRQYAHLAERQASHEKQRRREENQLTHFDETGLIVVSDQESLLALIREHHWQRLFLEQRDQLLQSLRFIVFGHGLYEKAVSPYIGMTGQALLILTEDIKKLTQPIENLDNLIPDILKSHDPKHRLLWPVPLLGYPGWYADQSFEFYQNKQYFR